MYVIASKKAKKNLLKTTAYSDVGLEAARQDAPGIIDDVDLVFRVHRQFVGIFSWNFRLKFDAENRITRVDFMKRLNLFYHLSGTMRGL